MLLVEMSSTTRCLWKCLLQHVACGNVFYNTLLVEMSSTTRCLWNCLLQHVACVPSSTTRCLCTIFIFRVSTDDDQLKVYHREVHPTSLLQNRHWLQPLYEDCSDWAGACTYMNKLKKVSKIGRMWTMGYLFYH